MTADVVVCGAGVGGLACAYALGALGLTVVVLDRAAGPAAVAKGELLQPEAVRILDGWGALPAGAVPVDRLAIRDPAGAPLLDIDYGTLPGEYRQILCSEYTDVLAALAARLGTGVEVRRGVSVDGPLLGAGGRVVGVRTRDRGDVAARLVVAADGLSSRLRRAVRVPAGHGEYGHRLLAFELAGTAWPAEVSAFLTEQGLRLVYPLPGGRCRLYVQVGADELRAGGGRGPAWAEALLAAMPALGPLAAALPAALPSRQVLAVHRLRARRMAAPGLALAGEAAHAVHPMAAQGMNSSLADAESLAAHLAAAGGLADGAVDRALRGYQRARLPRLAHTATVSHNAARMLTVNAGFGRILGRRMMRNTAANQRLVGITAGNLAGVALRPLTPVDRLYQLGLLTDPAARRPAGRR